MAGGYGVYPEDLDAASGGIDGAVAEVGQSTLGGMSGGAETFGHPGVASAFSMFRDHAGWRIDDLRRQAQYHSDGLRATSGQYRDTEASNVSALSTAGAAL
ncbi:MAG: hypothetical protein J2O49_06410 [Sciscionella sp.]|nr:hypothetical protein [Sciscionella sp.]